MPPSSHLCEICIVYIFEYPVSLSLCLSLPSVLSEEGSLPDNHPGQSGGRGVVTVTVSPTESGQVFSPSAPSRARGGGESLNTPRWSEE